MLWHEFVPRGHFKEQEGVNLVCHFMTKKMVFLLSGNL